MVKITAPEKGFNGTVGPVQFTDGEAVTDNHAVISYCRDLGYTVETVEPAEDEPAEESPEGQAGTESAEPEESPAAESSEDNPDSVPVNLAEGETVIKAPASKPRSRR